MTRGEFANLQVGDLIRHKLHSDALVVTGNYGDYIVAVRTQHVSNPSEWDLVSRARHHDVVFSASCLRCNTLIRTTAEHAQPCPDNFVNGVQLSHSLPMDAHLRLLVSEKEKS